MENRGQLQYPLDPESKAAVRQVVDEILTDKSMDIVWNNSHWMSFIESSVWARSLTGSATVAYVAGTNLATGATSGSVAELRTDDQSDTKLTFTNAKTQQRIRTQFKVSSGAMNNQVAYIVRGDTTNDTYYGFMVVDASLYAVSRNGGAQSASLLKTIGADTLYELEARFYPSNRVVFYVDRTATATISTNLPTGVNLQMLGNFSIQNSTTASKNMTVYYYEYLQQLTPYK